MDMKRRILNILLALVMAVGILATAAFAEDLTFEPGTVTIEASQVKDWTAYTEIDWTNANITNDGTIDVLADTTVDFQKSQATAISLSAK